MAKRAGTDRQWASMPTDPVTLRSVPPVLVPGAMVGTFSVELVLGAGAMADVVGVEDRAANRRLALKIARAGDAESLRRLRHEAELLKQIAGQGAPRIYGTGALPDGRGYLAMDWLDGETLGARLERGPLSPQDAARLAAGIARALKAVHAAGVIHSDLKPDNIFLVGRQLSSVTLLDFGVSDRVGVGARQHVDGTPLYLSPEQASGAPLTPAADLYALGVVLFAAVAGRPPFVSDDPHTLLRMHLDMAAPTVKAFVPTAPAEMDALVSSLLIKAPRDRATLADVELAVGLRRDPAPGRRVRRDSPGVVFVNAAAIPDEILAQGSAPPSFDQLETARTIVAPPSLPAPITSGRWTSPTPVPHVTSAPRPATAPIVLVPPPGITFDLGAHLEPKVDLRPRRSGGFFLTVLGMAAVAVAVAWWMTRTPPPTPAVIKPIDALVAPAR